MGVACVSITRHIRKQTHYLKCTCPKISATFYSPNPFNVNAFCNKETTLSYVTLKQGYTNIWRWPWFIHYCITCSLVRPTWSRAFLGGELKDPFHLVCRPSNSLRRTSSHALHPPPASSFTKQQLLRASHVNRHCIMPKLQARRNAFFGNNLSIIIFCWFWIFVWRKLRPPRPKNTHILRRFKWKWHSLGFFLMCIFILI